MREAQVKTFQNKAKSLVKQILDLETTLNSNILTTLWISDLHGEGDRFASILKGRFGVLYQTCVEALPKTFSPEKITYLGRVIRKGYYYESRNVPMDRQDVIRCLVDVLKYKVNNVRYEDADLISPEYREIILRLISDAKVPDMVFENELFAQRLVNNLSAAIKKVLIDHIVVLGDIFDRGSQPDKIIRILSSKPFKNIVHLVYGNHDVLWMGACAGNLSLIAEAMRITCRYNHMDLLRRLRIDESKLREFAIKTYPPETTTGKFKAQDEAARSMEKALAVIQFKLEEVTIRKHPEFDMDKRLWLHKLSEMLESGETDGLLDSYFPTVQADDPTRLSDEERAVFEDLRDQFLKSQPLKQLMSFFFESGKTYHVYNSILNIHALIPSNQEGDFDEFLGLKGKALLDHIQNSIYTIGQNYIHGKEQEEKDMALMFYLWCGPKSPFFGKHAMKTFERYFMEDKATHKEKTLYWESNLRNKAFQNRIKKEFEAERVVYGHTPRDYYKGQKIASPDGFAIDIDGGFAEAYFNRGHSLVQTPKQIYGLVLPTPDELKHAAQEKRAAKLGVEIIEDREHPQKVKDTWRGNYLQKKKEKLMQELNELTGDH